MNRENTFSVTVMVIVMALLAVFVGYLLGNWLIQLVTGNSPDTQQVVEREIVKEEIIEDSDDSTGTSSLIPAPSEKEEDTVENYAPQEQLMGEVFVVQVGAFNSYNNAVKLKDELATKGFQAVITEGVPYKVQLGATNKREDAEKKEEELEALGFNAFITH